MDLVAAYSSDPEDEEHQANTDHLKPEMISQPVKSAPLVVGAAPKALQPKYLALYDPKKAAKGLRYNAKKEVLMAPSAGPKHPFRTQAFMPHLGAAAHANGYIAPTNVDQWAFEEQFHTYNSYGYAMDTRGQVVGDSGAYRDQQGDSVSTMKPAKRKRSGKKAEDPILKAARAEAAREFDLGSGGGSGGLGGGPWAEHRDEDAELLEEIEAKNHARMEEAAEKKKKAEDEFDVNADLDRRDERKFSHLLPARHDKNTKAMEPKSVFHGKKGTEVDYQGRSWVEPPLGVRPLSSEGDEIHDSFVPKKCIHRFTGHKKGVQAIRWFPDTGHLLLSASYDGTVKIWDVHNSRSVRRTYTGHSEGVRDVNFTNDGRHFITASFDRYMRYWDTETGQCVSTFCNRKVPYQVKFHPIEQDQFLMASSDNRIWQWDIKTGETVQEYNHHIQSVNSVLICDDGKRFVSTADDKKILVWEWGIPVPMKYITDPTMHAVPTTALHPWGQHFTAQSMENEIHVYGARDRFRRMRKKVFRGHVNAGYACQITYSPNGKYMASGDGEGRLFVWDWKSTKQIRRFRAHDDGPCIDAQWHPLEPSWVATCGWDGTIKLWD